MLQKMVTTVFTQKFEGELIGPRGTAKIGVEEGTLAPYDMLFGALAACLYSTFLDVSIKKRIAYETCTLEVTGEKRKDVPTTLKWVHVKATVLNAQKEAGLEEAFRLATQYCSIYQTLSHVAEMTYEIQFKYH